MRRENNFYCFLKDIEEVKVDVLKIGVVFIVGGNLFVGFINSLCFFYV